MEFSKFFLKILNSFRILNKLFDIFEEILSLERDGLVEFSAETNGKQAAQG